jgi:outer membrane receptor for ferrienterochelin and colicin
MRTAAHNDIGARIDRVVKQLYQEIRRLRRIVVDAGRRLVRMDREYREIGSRFGGTQDQTACGTFTRSGNGNFATATSTYYNAGYIKYRGQTIKVNYQLAMEKIFSGSSDIATFDVEGTHTSKYEESDTGFKTDAVRYDGTVDYPDWRILFDVHYTHGPMSIFYSLSYYPSEKSGYYDTVETTPNYKISANSVSSESIQYQFPRLSLRAGITNIFDKAPSFPTFTYGDALGRRFFVGANIHF